MKNEMFAEILELLGELNDDDCTPKVIRLKLREIHNNLLNEEESVSMRVDKSLQGLDDIGEDANMPTHIKTQVWDIVSKLESITQ
jgi:uncharacterized protein (UPF0147 family)